jgi:hypothetical protein
LSSKKTSKLCNSPDSSSTTKSNSFSISSANLAAVDLYAQDVQCWMITRTSLLLCTNCSSLSPPANSKVDAPSDSKQNSKPILPTTKTSSIEDWLHREIRTANLGFAHNLGRSLYVDFARFDSN